MLLFSDPHVDSASIAEWHTVVDEIIAYAQQYKVREIACLGDAKTVFSPIPGAVLNAVQTGLQHIAALGCRCTFLMGNHDYYSPRGGDSWAGVLAKTGFEVISAPCTYRMRLDTQDVYVRWVPFQHDPENFLQAIVDPSADVLLFHQGLNNAELRTGKMSGIEAISASQIPANYKYAIGGHYHNFHRVQMWDGMETNVWYCGTPRCTSWAEANAPKGYVLLTDKGVQHLPSKLLPGWFDPSLPGYDPARVTEGARVRLHVSVKATASRIEVEQSVALAKSAFGKPVQFETVTDYTAENLAVVDIADPIRSYVDVAFAQELQSMRADIEQVVRSVFAEPPTLKMPSAHFEYVEAENFLSWQQLSYVFKPGVHLLTGPTGAGKTSLLHSVAAGMFGETLKEQTADGWRRRHADPKERSNIRLMLQTKDGKDIEMYRQRSPGSPSVRIMVDGTNRSSGRGDGEINALLTALTGLNMDVLRSALFVDQREVNALLTGKPSEQKNILSAFLGLERFVPAQKQITTLLKDAQQARQEALQRYAGIESQLITLRDSEAKLAAVHGEQIERIEAQRAELMGKLRVLGDGPAAAYDVIYKELRRVEQAKEAAQGELAHFQRQLKLVQDEETKNAQRVIKSVCSACGNSLTRDQVKSAQREKDLALQLCLQQQAALETKVEASAKVSAETSARYSLVYADYKALELALSNWRIQRQSIDQTDRALASQLQAAKAAQGRVSHRGRIRQLEQYLRILGRVHEEIYEYPIQVLSRAAKAVSRDGIPLSLIAAVVPRLNAAAQKFSRILCGGKIGVSFAVEGDALTVNALNEMGGDSLKAQSAGETRLVTLGVTLALRSLIDSNVLFLDEPTLGMDAECAAIVASAIEALRHEFKCIMVVSHDPTFLAGVEFSTLVEVYKQGNASKIR